jgi:hypothetical protein
MKLTTLCLFIAMTFSSALLADLNDWRHVSLKSSDGLEISIDFRKTDYQSSGSYWVDTHTYGDVWINLYGAGTLQGYNKVSVLLIDGNGHSNESLIPLKWSQAESKFTSVLVTKERPIRIHSRYTANRTNPDQKFCQSLVVVVDAKILEPTFRFCMSDY